MNPKQRVLLLILVFGLMLLFSQKFLSLENKNKTELKGNLYLPEHKYLNFISLGNENLISDLVLAKALTYYGSHYSQRKTFTFPHLKVLFMTACQMDPDNKQAVQIGNNILNKVDITAANQLLKLGMFYHPDFWKFPEMIGFNYFYYLKNSYQAARFYEMAARLPGHPPYVPSLSSKFYQESGRLESALRVLHNFYSTAEDKRLKNSFKESIAAVKKKIWENNITLKARISRVIDGDSFRIVPDRENPRYSFLQEEEELRLVGINSYEMNAENEREQLFAFLQRDYAYHHLNNREVKLQFERLSDGSLKRDRFKRLLGYIFILNNNYQETALKKGMVSGYYLFPFNRSFKARFQAAEKIALQNKAGLLTFPPAEINFRDISSNIGRLVTLRFRVASVNFTNNYIYLNSGSDYRNAFTVVIPMSERRKFRQRSYRNFFRGFRNTFIKVSGFLGIRDQQPQIRLYFPVQLVPLL